VYFEKSAKEWLNFVETSPKHSVYQRFLSPFCLETPLERQKVVNFVPGTILTIFLFSSAKKA
jgi:hypothetical protein